jgi:L-ascorbate metabolism protein UlaG (beta-lactamase superfamily)
MHLTHPVTRPTPSLHRLKAPWKLPAWVVIALVALLLAGCHPRPRLLRQLEITASEDSPQGLQIQFLGNTNLLLDDGETRILTDGFFSRPGTLKLIFGKVKPKEKRIRECLATAGITRLDAVIPVHSHYDHALDAPLVAKLTGATLIGSPSTLMIGEGGGLAAGQMLEAPLDSVLTIGKFNIRFLASRHWQYPAAKQRKKLLDQPIEHPLVPPASIYEYKEGISYTILIEHEGLRIAIQGSAGYLEDLIRDFDADLLFLSVAGLGAMDSAYNAGYQQQVVEALNPEVIVPIHWDAFTVPLKRRLKGPSLLVSTLSGSKLKQELAIVREHNPGRKIKVLPLWGRFGVRELTE